MWAKCSAIFEAGKKLILDFEALLFNLAPHRIPLIYHREPSFSSHAEEPAAEASRAPYQEKMRRPRIKIPTELSFEEVVERNTHSPCSLDDFMNYLAYVERSAENLEFFLWYYAYVKRWSRLPRLDKERSPVWNTGRRETPQSPSWSVRLMEKTEKLNRILSILDQDTATGTQQTTMADEPELEPGPKCEPVEINFSRPRTPAFELEIRESDPNEWRWEPFSAQPFRDEVTRVALHYISTSGPRKLSLARQDRTTCLHALQHTTHPSAFLPAVLAAETMLRAHSHPNFIRWSICNSNRPRVLFARVLGGFILTLAFTLDLILILSKSNRLARISAVPLWHVGLSILLIEGRGISIKLYMNNRRQLRPWEQAADLRPRTGRSELKNTQAGPHRMMDLAGHRRQHAAGVHPLFEEGPQDMGPANDFRAEPWVQLYREKSIWRRVFEVSAVHHNRHLRVLQDKAVFISLLWASFLMVVLTVGSVLIPPGRVF